MRINITCDDSTRIMRLEANLHQHFQFKHLFDLRYFLDTLVDHLRLDIISLNKNILDMLKKTD